MSLTLVLLLGVAILLIYAAVKNQNPVDIIKVKAFGGKGAIKPLSDKVK